MSFTLSDYQITATLFSNERTAVKRAVRASDGHSVILKQLVAAYPQPGHLARFSFGYEVLSKFQHPNIVRPLAWLSGQEDHLPTMVLEDKHSEDLFRYLQRFEDHRLPLETFLDMAVQLAEALSVVHYNQVIHKDLHPGNILINPVTGLTQLTDFGLASLLSREQPVLETPEKLEGVLAYISPEQTGRMNRALDYRSDFYTLGCTFYHLLSGHPPFSAEDALGLVHAHIARQQPPLTEHRPDMPQVLSDIIDKLLNKTAEERYQSALGLKKDLEKVQFALASNKPIPEFPLGMEDISDRFQVPQKLYGRADEVDLLMKRFFSAAGGKPRMLAIAGYSGIGKSALVHEVHKPIAAYNGLFCAGKFDQFQKNVPYSALQTALKGWIQHTLSLTEQRLTEKRDHLQNALGSNARVLIDFMPEFELVLGNLPPVATLGADETQNRFHLVFQQFVKTITHERPLVLFIDDIQWADRGTLNLLPLLMSEEGCRLLVIVAYRDNEVDASHPAIHTLTQIEQAPSAAGELSRITLGPLPETEVSQLLQDALHRPANEVAPLVALVHAKTAGNPFFIGEFLKTLYTEKLLDFDLTRQRWVWTIADIDAKGITDNVVDLMLGKMALLPTDTQEIIQLAACVGSRFDLDMLAKVAELPLTVVTRKLWPALRDGLLLQDGGDWYLGWVEQSAEQQPMRTEADHVLSQSSPMSPQCRFLHDRMLQAAYQSMSEDKRQHTHLRVGRLLFMGRSVETLSNTECFDITEQLNHAQSLIQQEEEREILIQLNLRSAWQAKSASVWEAALRYASLGLSLLPVNPWHSRYETTSSLYRIKAECDYLTGHVDASDVAYEELLQHLTDAVARAEIGATRLAQCIGRGRWLAGITYGKQALDSLGRPLPEDNGLNEAITAARVQLSSHTADGVVRGVLELPVMSSAPTEVEIHVLCNLAAAESIVGHQALSELCVLRALNLIIRFGQVDLAATVLAQQVIRLFSSQDYTLAVAQAEEALRVAHCYHGGREIVNCYNMVSITVWSLKASLQECVELNEKAFQLGMENGDIGRAVISFCNTLFFKFAQGQQLRTLQLDAKNAEALANKYSVFASVGLFMSKLLKALIAPEKGGERALDSSCFSSTLMQQIEQSFHYAYLLNYRITLAFWYEDYPLVQHWSHALAAIKGFQMNLTVVESAMFQGLALLKQCRGQLSVSDKAKLQEYLRTTEQFAKCSRRNFGAMHALLETEAARVQVDSSIDPVKGFHQAMDLAESSGQIQIHALAAEFFADYLLGEGVERLAIPLIQDARRLYERWGCTVKVRALDKRFPQYLQKKPQTVSTSTYQSGVSTTTRNSDIDLASIMKSVQIISGELEVSKLVGKILEAIIESTGASTGALITNHSGTFCIEALSGQGAPAAAASTALEETTDVPVNIVQYVLHSGELVHIPDVSRDRTFAKSEYFKQHHPSALLCVPLVFREETAGALYLENDLAAGAFTPDRLDVTRLLMAQAAISLENARLFRQVKQLNETLEEKVARRTGELNTALGKLEGLNQELNAFSYSVSHDLRAPLRVMKGFSHTLMEDYSDGLAPEAKMMLTRIEKNAEVMNELILALLELSRIQRKEVLKEALDLSALVAGIQETLTERHPEQKVNITIAPDVQVHADHRLMHAALENLLSNAWKYSSLASESQIEFGWLRGDGTQVPDGIGERPETLQEGARIFYVKDNGAGFDMTQAGNLFQSFHRLHSSKQFEGMGIGLATVKRIIEKHGGSIWAYAQPNEGATFYFTLSCQ